MSDTDNLLARLDSAADPNVWRWGQIRQIRAACRDAAAEVRRLRDQHTTTLADARCPRCGEWVRDMPDVKAVLAGTDQPTPDPAPTVRCWCDRTDMPANSHTRSCGRESCDQIEDRL